ncbi:MAG: Hsp70 family protein [Erysipelotrichaceae bacterium]|nr:Hsp70 family protein [Erysipelotrichaceae bacterium]
MLIGIDLGTTNSLAACFHDGAIRIIPNRLGKKLTPSVVSVGEDHSVMIGETAKEYGFLHPDRTARLFKRTMGTDKTYALGEQSFRSEELSALILRSLKEDAEAFLGEKVGEAIISVPAYFNDKQRRMTRMAGELAGLKVDRIISEPTASALAYGVGEKGIGECCMVLDLGGGTFDVTILEYYHNIIEVYAVAGDNGLGGEDFTTALIELFLKENDLSVNDLDLGAFAQIYKDAEQCKCAFNGQEPLKLSAVIGGRRYESRIDPKEYETACLGLLERMRRPIERSLSDAGVTLNDLDRIILVGGGTRLPLVRSYIRKMTGIFSEYSVDPDTSVALGAAIAAAMKERNSEISEVILTDVCPFTLGTEVVTGEGDFTDELQYLPIIERNTVIPVSRTETVYTSKDGQTAVSIKILQGESRIPSANLLIGRLNIEVPAGPKGQEAIEITYTYDVNSLLEVKAKVLSTGLEKKIFIQDEDHKMTEEEAAERMKRIEYLKQNPREDEENEYALLKASRVFEEAGSRDRKLLEKQLSLFEDVLDHGNRLEIDVQRSRLLELIDRIEDDDSGLLLS